MRALVVALTIATGGYALSVVLRPSGSEVVWADLWLYNGVMLLGAAIAVLCGVVSRPWSSRFTSAAWPW